MDPCSVLERKQAQQQRQHAKTRQGKQERARAGIEQLFKGEDDMGRKLEIAPHITTALHQWGEWANRKQFWANLNVTPFCKLVGIGAGRELPEVRLDPQSMAVHRAFHRMQCEITRIVLVGYYVGGLSWDDRQSLYKDKYGVSRNEFYEILKRGSIALFNAAKL
ncbi:hypothetical protein [Pusillimonas sp. T7-7]|uniref:hypothetical protein n=1 Tax=Pusillimonas sp. (strain T7-7) TaxID=1007105 RepID=UPI0011D251C4|nr:hypothetical protein [Pusillimonas sp. T7-7]